MPTGRVQRFRSRQRIGRYDSEVGRQRGVQRLRPRHLDRLVGLRLLGRDDDPPLLTAADERALQRQAGQVLQAQRPGREQGDEQAVAELHRPQPVGGLRRCFLPSACIPEPAGRQSLTIRSRFERTGSVPGADARFDMANPLPVTVGVENLRHLVERLQPDEDRAAWR